MDARNCKSCWNASEKATPSLVTRINRLARSMKDLQDIVHELREKGVSLKATEQPIDTGSAPERHSSTCWACLPSLRQSCAGSVSLKGTASKGSIKPEPSIDVARVKALRNAGKGPAAIAKELKMARSSVYRVLGQTAESRSTNWPARSRAVT